MHYDATQQMAYSALGAHESSNCNDSQVPLRRSDESHEGPLVVSRSLALLEPQIRQRERPRYHAKKRGMVSMRQCDR